jgi:hypothetical protein
MSGKKYASDYPPTMPLRERIAIMNDAQAKYPNELCVQRIAQYLNKFYVDDIDPENILDGMIPITNDRFVDITKLSIEDAAELNSKYGHGNDLGFAYIMLIIVENHAVIRSGDGFGMSRSVDLDKLLILYSDFPEIIEQTTAFRQMLGNNVVSDTTYENLVNANKRILAEKKKIAAFKDIVHKNKGTINKNEVLEFIARFP